VSNDELILRQNAAKILAKIVVSNDVVKYPNLKPHLLDMMKKKLVSLFDSFKSCNYPIISAILKFFSEMDSVTIKLYLLDFLIKITNKDSTYF
jgi:hypothetical protein